jgi:HEAT repeat protein
VDDAVEETERRRRVAVAGHTGDAVLARAHLTDPAPGVRATALGALSRLGVVTDDELRTALADPATIVRRRAAAEARERAGVDLVPLLADPEPLVVEAAAWALGERATPEARTVERLSVVATSHEDPLAREAAVAALGAIGDPAGLPAILQATRDRPAIRRRATLALAPFEGPEVDEALQRALADRDWQVRQAAEDLLADD